MILIRLMNTMCMWLFEVAVSAVKVRLDYIQPPKNNSPHLLVGIYLISAANKNANKNH